MRHHEGGQRGQWSHDSRGGGRHGRGGRHRARRGAVVLAILTLLDEGPKHGYELINELDERSEGRWRPSPGSMYPALGRLEGRGLIEVEEIDGKKTYSLTEAGRRRLADLRSERGDDAPPPWNDHGTGERGRLRREVSELVGQLRQIGRFGTAEQIDEAVAVLDDARSRLDDILASRTDSGEAADRQRSDPGDDVE